MVLIFIPIIWFTYYILSSFLCNIDLTINSGELLYGHKCLRFIIFTILNTFCQLTHLFIETLKVSTWNLIAWLSLTFRIRLMKSSWTYCSRARGCLRLFWLRFVFRNRRKRTTKNFTYSRNIFMKCFIFRIISCDIICPSFNLLILNRNKFILILIFRSQRRNSVSYNWSSNRSLISSGIRRLIIILIFQFKIS
jgi:hypothetical protein